MIADSVFGFAASHIQLSIQNDVTCSILSSLISKEDAILDAVSFGRATTFGQVGGARDLENNRTKCHIKSDSFYFRIVAKSLQVDSIE